MDEAAVVKEIKEQNDEFISRLKPVEVRRYSPSNTVLILHTVWMSNVCLRMRH